MSPYGAVIDVPTYFYNLCFFSVANQEKRQFAVNFRPKSLFFLISLWFLYIVHSDLQVTVSAARELALFEIKHCANEYDLNRCAPEERVPIAREYCEQMENCMSRNPWQMTFTTIAWAKLFAEILNGFADTLSVRSVGLLVLGLLMTVLMKTHSKPKAN